MMKSFVPLILFLILFIGSGIYFEFSGVEYAFYQISPVVILIPSIILAICISGKHYKVAINKFAEGMADQQVISMVIIFLLAGAFTSVTKTIGGVESIVNLILSVTSSTWIIPSVFIISALLGTAMGTSMGVIAAVVPIAIAIADQIGGYKAVCVATVISGATFGDNLSLISDTTIAAVNSQSASLVKKFKLNAVISTIAAILTLLVLIYFYRAGVEIAAKDYSVVNIIPYIVVTVLALLQVHVFVVLLIGILCTGVVGFITLPSYSVILYAQGIYSGFLSVNEVMLLSLFISGLIYLTKERSFSALTVWICGLNMSQRMGKYVISGLISISDILLANNTIAIIFTGGIAKELAKRNNIKPYVSAFLLDTFSCVFQGIIPHGAQIILASSLSGINPLILSLHVFFCYIIAMVTLIYIACGRS